MEATVQQRKGITLDERSLGQVSVSLCPARHEKAEEPGDPLRSDVETCSSIRD